MMEQGIDRLAVLQILARMAQAGLFVAVGGDPTLLRNVALKLAESFRDTAENPATESEP